MPEDTSKGMIQHAGLIPLRHLKSPLVRSCPALGALGLDVLLIVTNSQAVLAEQPQSMSSQPAWIKIEVDQRRRLASR